MTTDLIHTVFGNVRNGQMTLDNSLPAGVHAFVGSAPSESFYTSTGTGLDVLGQTCAAGDVCTEDDKESVRVSYASGSGQPLELFGPLYGQVYPGDAAQSEVQPDGCRFGGYLGFDGSKLCWATGAGCQFQSYSQICEMATTTTLGATVTIECQHTSNPPRPTSGSTCASGCPAITADYSKTLTLVAR